MEIKAKLKNLRISPRKVRLVTSLIKGLKTEDAINQLSFLNKKSTLPVSKLIKSAVASAENNFELEKDNLFIKEIRVDEGVKLKRWMPKARGRATTIRKRTSQIDLVIGEIVDSGKKESKKAAIDAPIKLDSNVKEEGGAKVEDEKKTKNRNTSKTAGKEKIVDPRGEGHGKHTKIEGKSTKGFVGKMFRRKSG